MTRTARIIVIVLSALMLAGCSLSLFKRKPPEIPICDPAKSACVPVNTPTEDTVRPQHRAGMTSTAKGLVEGRSAAILDKSTEAEKRAALAVQPAAERELGKTVASLGDVGRQGFWLLTPLVSKESEGRVVWADNGNSVNVTLIPKGGEVSSGSQISLAAMRALEIPLTTLANLIVFAK